MQFWTYMLQCADGSYYVGHTDDLERRLAMHQGGSLGGYTASRRPVTLIHAEPFDNGSQRVLILRQARDERQHCYSSLIIRFWGPGLIGE